MNTSPKSLNPELAVRVGLSPIKTLMFSYLRLFTKKNLFSLSQKLGRNVFTIPQKYVEHAEMLSAFELTRAGISQDSLYYIPLPGEPIEFKYISQETLQDLSKMRADIVRSAFTEFPDVNPDEYLIQKWELSLIVIDENSKNDFSFSAKGDIPQQIVDLIDSLYSSIPLLFTSYFSQFPELRSVGLSREADNLILVDSSYPKYHHSVKLHYKFVRRG